MLVLIECPVFTPTLWAPGRLAFRKLAHVDFERGGSVLDFYAQTGLVRSRQRLETLLLVVVLDDWLGGQVEGLLQIDLVLENAQDGLGAVAGSL